MDAIAAACAPRPSWKHRCPGDDRRSPAWTSTPRSMQARRVLYSYDQPGGMSREDGSRRVGRRRVEASRQVEPFSEDSDEVGVASSSAGSAETLAEDEAIDFITGDKVKLRGNEEVRQQVARALYVEYGIRVQDMQRDFPIAVEVDGRKVRKKADIAIFEPETKHELANLRRVVICKPEPKGRRSVTKVRTYTQAEKDLADLETLLGTEATPQVQYGMWTNGIDFFYLHKTTTKFSAKFEPQASWPLADESVRPEHRRLRGTAAPRRGRDAQDDVPPLP